MLYNYLKIAFRNIIKHRGYSFINIAGLAIGIACCLLIFLYVKDELTYDKFHRNYERLYRITTVAEFGGRVNHAGASGYPEGEAYKFEVPEIEEIARIDNQVGIVQKGDAYVQERGLVHTDEALFEIFDFETITGSLSGSLSSLNSIVITEQMALKHFGKTEVIGDQLMINIQDEPEAFYVTAVIANHPSNSSFDFDMALSWAKRLTQVSPSRLNSWSNISLNTFVLLSADADPSVVEKKIREVRVRRNPGEDGVFARDLTNELQYFADIHSNMDIRSGDGLRDSSDPVYSYVLTGIAMLILILACINFTNLSVARSLPRAKEIGVRKVLGARQKQLAFQFLNESLMMSAFAFVLGLVLAEFSLPIFGRLLQKRFLSGVTDDPVLMVSCLGLVLFTALLSGSYPSFVISRFNTILSLKGRVKMNGKAKISRALVVIQFAIAAILIVATAVMNRQIDYMVKMDLGYNDQNLIRIRAANAGTPNLSQLFRDKLAQNPNISMVAAADDYGSSTFFDYKDAEYISVFTKMDDNYLDIKGIELIEGRELKNENDLFVIDGDTLINVVVNETFVKELGIENPLYEVVRDNRIVGVIKDFHFNSVKGKISPLMFYSISQNDAEEFEQIFVKFKPEFLPRIQETLEEVWQEYVPNRPFQSVFVDEANASRYEEEMRWKSIISNASGLAILISIMGLFGLAHLATLQRIKEIGIRKVLGASLSQIVVLLSSSFARLVLLSIVIAIPIAYYLTNEWLDNFANRIGMDFMLFSIPGAITFSVAFLAVALQSLKSANANPVDSLRHE